MGLSSILRTWWVILIQGILLIGISIYIFSNPLSALTAISFWLGVSVIITAVVGMMAYFSNSKGERDFPTLFGSIVLLILGVLMISKMLVTIKAITLAFGLLAAFVGLALIVASWRGRNQWSKWWIIALIGVIALGTGIKSSLNMYSGTQAISNLYGFAIFASGVGMVFMAFLKKKIVMTINTKV